MQPWIGLLGWRPRWAGEDPAGALVASIPVAVVYTFFLDRFVAGFTMGSVK
jgi:multiple sugar transport system permease protein